MTASTIGDLLTKSALDDFVPRDLFNAYHAYASRTHESMGLSKFVGDKYDFRVPWDDAVLLRNKLPNDTYFMTLFVHTPDAGYIPTLYGSVQLYPLQNDALCDHLSAVLKSGSYKFVDDGYTEAVIHNLQDYSIPRRIQRSINKAQQCFIVRTLTTESEFLSYRNAYDELHRTSTGDEPLLKTIVDLMVYSLGHYSTLFNTVPIPNYAEAVKDIVDNSAYAGTEFLNIVLRYYIELLRTGGYAVQFVERGGKLCAVTLIQIDRATGRSYWITTDRKRDLLNYDRLLPKFNFNDLLISYALRWCKSEGFKSFNLGLMLTDGAGVTHYDYKQNFNPVIEWRKGLRI